VALSAKLRVLQNKLSWPRAPLHPRDTTNYLHNAPNKPAYHIERRNQTSSHGNATRARTRPQVDSSPGRGLCAGGRPLPRPWPRAPSRRQIASCRRLRCRPRRRQARRPVCVLAASRRSGSRGRERGTGPGDSTTCNILRGLDN